MGGSVKRIRVMDKKNNLLDYIETFDRIINVGPLLDRFIIESEYKYNEISLPNTLKALNEDHHINASSVCIIDDDVDYLNVSVRYIQILGHYVQGFSDPDFAFDELKRDPSQFNVIIIDENMPGVKGHNYIKLLEELKVTTNIKLTSASIDKIPHLNKKFNYPVVQKTAHMINIIGAASHHHYRK